MELREFCKADAREVWGCEEKFSDWLAKNIDSLSKVIGIDMKVLNRESPAGNNRIDILAMEESSGYNIIIENQFGKSDHDHLGKTLAYAASREAKLIIWIVEKVTQEHKWTIDWLNKSTNANMNFFIVQIECIKVKNLGWAYQFNIVAQSNNQISGDYSERREDRRNCFRYWRHFEEYMNREGSSFKGKRRKEYWGYEFVIDDWDAVKIRLEVSGKERNIACMFVVADTAYSKLKLHKTFITKKLESFTKTEDEKKLQWISADQRKKENKIIKYLNRVDLSDEDQWPTYFQWMEHKLENFYEVYLMLAIEKS